MTESQELVGHIRYLLSRGGSLRGRRVVVTAGGTQEPVDPVRVISNRSSGKQGFALAQAALDAGAAVTLIASAGSTGDAGRRPARRCNHSGRDGRGGAGSVPRRRCAADGRCGG